MPAKSAVFSPSSSIRALSLGDIYLAPDALAGTGNPSIVGVTLRLLFGSLASI